MIVIHVTCIKTSSINIKNYPANNEEADLKKDIKPLSYNDCVRYRRGCQVPSAQCQPRWRLKVPVSDPGEGKYWRLQHCSTAAPQHCSTAAPDQDTGLCNPAVLHTAHQPAHHLCILSSVQCSSNPICTRTVLCQTRMTKNYFWFKGF